MVLFTDDEVTEEEAFAAMVANKEDNPTMVIDKPFGKAGFGKGKYEKAPYYLKDLQVNRINKKLKLIKHKLQDIKNTVDLLLDRLDKLR